MSLLNRLNEPFPSHQGVKSSAISLLGISAFVTLFLYFFRPFGISQMQDDVLLICALFGMVTFVFGITFDLFNLYVLKIRTDIPEWTLWKWIVQTAFLIVWIAIGNILLLYLLNASATFDIAYFGQMIFNTLLIGIFPIIFSGLINQMQADKVNRREAKDIHLNTPSEDQPAAQREPLQLSEFVSVEQTNIVFLEAQQNYVNVHYLREGRQHSELIRTTLSGLEEQLDSRLLVRCHRSYIVNIRHIRKVEGNAQGLRLHLLHRPDEIPVSRSYIPDFRHHFSH